MQATGRYIVVAHGSEKVRAFVPAPLPPIPPMQWNDEMLHLMEKAQVALGRLDSISTLLPDTRHFLWMYIRKEAVLSSQIEGTRSSLSDLLLFEMDELLGKRVDDARDVVNYVRALNHGLDRLRSGFPLSLRLIREIHGILLSSGRGSSKDAGEFRRSQNWIRGTRPGNAVYVPPPIPEIKDCLDNLEKYLHDQYGKTPTLVKAALAHVQFETIHPFLDGNGRLGRLLITFLMCAENVLREPVLYLSLYFKKNRNQYYDLLQKVRNEGAWLEWVRFFMEGVLSTSQQAVNTVMELRKLFADDRERIRVLPGRSSPALAGVHDMLQKNPFASITELAKSTRMSAPAVSKAMSRLQDMGIVMEITGRERGRVFSYHRYLDILNEGTELPES